MIYSLGNCPLCNRFSLLFHEICDRCLQSIEGAALPFEPPFVCPACHKVLLHEDVVCPHTADTPFVIHLYPFTYTCEQLVLRFKRDGIRRLSETLAYLLGPALGYVAKSFGTMVLVPVPCSLEKETISEWDPMLAVAKKCTTMYGIPSLDPIGRVGVRMQKDLDCGQLLQDASQAFELSGKDDFPDNHDVIVVLDDITTTGKSICACIDLLKQKHTVPVVGLCIAMD